jgi:hypothetical protein
MTPAAFLRFLWQEKPESLYILIWVRQGKSSHWFRDLADAAAFAQQVGVDRDVYVGVGLSAHDCGRENRCISDEVVGLAGFWFDFDLRVCQEITRTTLTHFVLYCGWCTPATFSVGSVLWRPSWTSGCADW